MYKFEIEIINYFETEGLVAEIYYASFQWAKIFRKNKELIVQFYPHPKKGPWDFPFQEAIMALEQAKNKLVKKFSAKNSLASKEPIDPKKINEQAHAVIDKILNHPEKTLIYGELSRFGKVIDIYAPGLGGARYTADNKFIGFLEP